MSVSARCSRACCSLSARAHASRAHASAPQAAMCRLQALDVPLPRCARAQQSRRSVIVRAEHEGDAYEPADDAMERMEKSVTSCEQELLGIRTGRAQPAMLQNIEVDYYGAKTPLPQIASVSSPDAQTLMVNVYDKSAMQSVEKAISDSDMGFNPNNNGEVIRINVPPLTEERRKEMTKLASAAGEEAKVAIRNVRRDVLKRAGKLDLGKDEQKGMEKEVQDLTDTYVKQVEGLVSKKNKDLTTV